MYYFKLTQSTCILNTGILMAWFRNNFGSIGERQVRYMLSNNRKKLILIGNTMVDVLCFGGNLGNFSYEVKEYRPIAREEMPYLCRRDETIFRFPLAVSDKDMDHYSCGRPSGYDMKVLELSYGIPAYGGRQVFTDINSIKCLGKEAYKLASLLDENETQRVILTQSNEMLEITLCQKSGAWNSENIYCVATTEFHKVAEMRGKGKIFISEEKACILIRRNFGIREEETLKKLKSFQGKITPQVYACQDEERKKEVTIELEESKFMRCTGFEEYGNTYYELRVY